MSALFSLPVLAEVWVAGLLSFIGGSLWRAARDKRTPPGDAVLLDLSFGMVAFVVLVLLLRIFSRIYVVMF